MSTALLITPRRRIDTRRGNSTASVDLPRVDLPRIDLPRVVSATSLNAHAEVRAMERPAVPNYALRRMVVGGLAAVTLIVAMFGVVAMSAGFTGSPASAASASPTDVAAAPSVHVAQAGDTLWSIANTYRGDIDRGRFIDALIRLNSGVEIQAGQAVWLP